MGKLKTPKAPEAPDPYKTAEAQYHWNTKTMQDQANINRVNQTGPMGSLTWHSDKDGRWTATQTLNPNLQGIMDNASKTLSSAPSGFDAGSAALQLLQPGSWGNGGGGGGSAGGSSSVTYNSAVSGPNTNGYPSDMPVSSSQPPRDAGSAGFDFVSSLPLASGLNAPTATPAQTLQMPGAYQRVTYGDAPPDAIAARGADPMTIDPRDVSVGAYQFNNTPLNINQANAGMAQAQQARDRSATLAQMGFGTQLTGLPSADQNVRQRLEDAMYAKSQSRLDPQFQQAESDLQSRLVNQGINPGSEAWQREMDNFARNRTDAYENARNSSIAQGAAELEADFRRGLSTRQQTASEMLSGQQLGQSSDLTNAQLGTQTSISNAGNQTQTGIANMTTQAENDRLLRQLETQVGLENRRGDIQMAMGNQAAALDAGKANQSTLLQNALQNRQIDATLSSSNRGQNLNALATMRGQDMNFDQGNAQLMSQYLAQTRGQDLNFDSQNYANRNNFLGQLAQLGTQVGVTGMNNQTSRDTANIGANAQMQSANIGAGATMGAANLAAQTAAQRMDLESRLGAPGAALQLAQLNNMPRDQAMRELALLNGVNLPSNMGGQVGMDSPNIGSFINQNYANLLNTYGQKVGGQNGIIGAGLGALGSWLGS